MWTKEKAIKYILNNSTKDVYSKALVWYLNKLKDTNVVQVSEVMNAYSIVGKITLLYLKCYKNPEVKL